MHVYLDHSATTPLDDEVGQKMLPYLSAKFGNPSSIHRFGQEARAAIDEARQNIAGVLNAERDEIIFTSGGTESDNLALRSIALGAKKKYSLKSPHIIISEIEHHAVLDTALDLKNNYGVDLSLIEVNKSGVVNPDELKKLIKKNTVLISVMYANNETGVVEPIARIADVIKNINLSRGHKIFFHTDAVQAAGALPLNVKELGIDALSLSAHKFYGPKGAGLLYLKKGTPFSTFMTGGGQERNYRSGTENVAGIVGMAKALKRVEGLGARVEGTRKLSQKLALGIKKIYPKAIELSADAERLPSVVSFIFPGFDAESLLIALDIEGIAASSGSACTIGSVEPSHVVIAMGYPKNYAKSLVRFSFGRGNTAKEVDYVLAKLGKIIARLSYNKTR